jgi:hypothetical protein
MSAFCPHLRKSDPFGTGVLKTLGLDRHWYFEYTGPKGMVSSFQVHCNGADNKRWKDLRSETSRIPRLLANEGGVGA